MPPSRISQNTFGPCWLVPPDATGEVTPTQSQEPLHHSMLVLQGHIIMESECQKACAGSLYTPPFPRNVPSSPFLQILSTWRFRSLLPKPGLEFRIIHILRNISLRADPNFFSNSDTAVPLTSLFVLFWADYRALSWHAHCPSEPAALAPSA